MRIKCFSLPLIIGPKVCPPPLPPPLPARGGGRGKHIVRNGKCGVIFLKFKKKVRAYDPGGATGEIGMKVAYWVQR